MSGRGVITSVPLPTPRGRARLTFKNTRRLSSNGKKEVAVFLSEETDPFFCRSARLWPIKFRELAETYVRAEPATWLSSSAVARWGQLAEDTLVATQVR